MVLGLRQGRVDGTQALQPQPLGAGGPPLLGSRQIQHLPSLSDWLMPQAKRNVKRSC